MAIKKRPQRTAMRPSAQPPETAQHRSPVAHGESPHQSDSNFDIRSNTRLVRLSDQVAIPAIEKYALGLLSISIAAVFACLIGTLTVTCRPYVPISIYMLDWMFNFAVASWVVAVTPYLARLVRYIFYTVPARPIPIQLRSRLYVMYFFVMVIEATVALMIGASGIIYARVATQALSLECQRNDEHYVWRLPEVSADEELIRLLWSLQRFDLPVRQPI